jgi:hypothetical protein
MKNEYKNFCHTQQRRMAEKKKNIKRFIISTFLSLFCLFTLSLSTFLSLANSRLMLPKTTTTTTMNLVNWVKQLNYIPFQRIILTTNLRVFHWAYGGHW